ncbi:MAG: DUF2892 domain-containing protein [candidate division Zixibacteria bacterium]|nr:DUF2892 domain-containing protein [candidate division Zixibacteria bacterium]
MKSNVGTTDKALRISFGLILIMIAILVSISVAFKIALVTTGTAILFSSIFGFCMFYRLFGISTCKLKIDR